MSEKLLKDLQETKQHLLTLYRSPSQFNILLHIINAGRPLKVKEITKEFKMTDKAVERALAKLYAKGLVRRNPLRRGTYSCDLRRLISCILLTYSDIAQYIKQKENRRKI